MRTILVVEDAPNLLRWLTDRIRLEMPGSEVVGVSNGTDALAEMTTAPPQLLVLDLALPPGAVPAAADPHVGLGLLEAATGLEPQPRVVVLSSLDLRTECLRRGANAFVSKKSSRMWPELRAQLVVEGGTTA
ncbi:MAG: response regulator [Armatimonadetes bacterium]|nr:response regulator [Armatimonadota bacterium]